MAWEPLRTDYTDAVWSGPKKYIMIENDDGTVSFQDVTIYSNKEKSFFGANDANQMNQRANELAKSLLPLGGTKGQILTKKTNADRDAEWTNLPEVDLSAYAPKASPVFTGSISLGRFGAVGEYSFAVGNNVEASGYGSFAEGGGMWGRTRATGTGSHAEGSDTLASGQSAHTEGEQTEAAGNCSHAEGYAAFAYGDFSHAGGFWTVASGKCQTVIGSMNIESSLITDKFIAGKGYTNTGNANCFRVTDTGVYATGAHNSTGADYAEMFEWADGNPNQEDRCGRFVTLDGPRIRLAGPEDGFILGIVSGNPSVVGDVHDDQWQGMYLYDIFGRPLWEDVEIPDLVDKEGHIIIPAHMERHQKLNPNYNNSQPYRPRSERPEWDAVGMLGKLVVIDDGSCEVNGWCTVGEGGIAVKSENRTKYRVMERLDETHIRVLIL